VRQHYGIGECDIVLFFMGWLYHFSGLPECLKKWRNATARTWPLSCSSSVTATRLRNCSASARKLGLEDYVVLAGKQPYEKIPEFIAASDICLLPAHDNAIMRDIVPIKMYEYMAMGKNGHRDPTARLAEGIWRR